MSTKPETTFIASVHKHVPLESVYHLKLHNMYTGGPADVWYSGKFDDLWVEYKFIVLPKRATTLIDIPKEFSKLQLIWLRERYCEGRNVCAIIGCKQGGVLLTHLAWEEAIYPIKFAQQLVDRQQIAKYIYQLTAMKRRCDVRITNRPA